jgi:hypothetical protein
MTKEQLQALVEIKEGADIWSPALARLLRGIERDRPDLVHICKPMGIYAPTDARPFFGAILTRAGHRAIKAAEKPFGWAVTVLISDRIVKLEDTSERKTFHYRGSRSTAISRAKMKRHAWKVESVEPVSEEAWRRALGNPEERRL